MYEQGCLDARTNSKLRQRWLLRKSNRHSGVPVHARPRTIDPPPGADKTRPSDLVRAQNTLRIPPTRNRSEIHRVSRREGVHVSSRSDHLCGSVRSDDAFPWASVDESWGSPLHHPTTTLRHASHWPPCRTPEAPGGPSWSSIPTEPCRPTPPHSPACRRSRYPQRSPPE